MWYYISDPDNFAEWLQSQLQAAEGLFRGRKRGASVVAAPATDEEEKVVA